MLYENGHAEYKGQESEQNMHCCIYMLLSNRWLDFYYCMMS